MKTLLELKNELAASLKKARDIASAAQQAKRDFTTDERAQVATHLDDARKLKGEIASHPDTIAKQRGHDDEMREQIAALDGGGNLNRSKSLAGDRNAWGRDFAKGLPYQPHSGAKDLLPVSGSVSVGQLSNTVGTLVDDGRASSLLKLLTIEPATGDAFSYLRETARVHRAKPVAVGEKKPELTYTLERVDDRIRTIATCRRQCRVTG